MMGELPFADRKHWRWRWCYSQFARADARLHRLVQVDEWDEDEPQRIVGRAACGRRLWWAMPGLTSRTARPRCVVCCRMVGVDPGDGAPYNAGVDA
jgi:hypothetical protein